ncbi:hypothetical protein ACRAWG_31170 [Methylobacterium sp. P31]
MVTIDPARILNPALNPVLRHRAAWVIARNQLGFGVVAGFGSTSQRPAMIKSLAALIPALAFAAAVSTVPASAKTVIIKKDD